MFSLKKIQQRARRSRRVATDRRSAAAPASSILHKRDCPRNNSRRITFSTTCTAMPFIKDVPPKNLMAGFPEVEQQITSRREVAAPSILRSGDRQRNKSRRVSISTTCTAIPFEKQEPPKNLMTGFPEVEQLIPRVEVVVEERPLKEEDAVSFGDSSGHENDQAEPIEQREMTRSLREVAAAPSILQGPDRQRNNTRRIKISTTCTAIPFIKDEPPKNLMAGFPEVEQVIRLKLPLFVREEEAQPRKEEDAVSFGHDADAEPIEQRKRRGGLRREVASLTGQLGEYWTVEPSAKRVRRKPERFIP